MLHKIGKNFHNVHHWYRNDYYVRKVVWYLYLRKRNVCVFQNLFYKHVGSLRPTGFILMVHYGNKLKQLMGNLSLQIFHYENEMTIIRFRLFKRHEKEGLIWSHVFLYRTPSGLEDVSKYPDLFASLLASGAWTLEELGKLAGKNFLRVYREVEKVRPSI